MRRTWIFAVSVMIFSLALVRDECGGGLRGLRYAGLRLRVDARACATPKLFGCIIVAR
jgi:hypothetical protein